MIVKAIESPWNEPDPPAEVTVPILMFVGASTDVLGAPAYVMDAVPFLRIPPTASGPDSTADVEYVTVDANIDAPQKRRATAIFFIKKTSSVKDPKVVKPNPTQTCRPRGAPHWNRTELYDPFYCQRDKQINKKTEQGRNFMLEEYWGTTNERWVSFEPKLAPDP